MKKVLTELLNKIKSVSEELPQDSKMENIIDAYSKWLKILEEDDSSLGEDTIKGIRGKCVAIYEESLGFVIAGGRMSLSKKVYDFFLKKLKIENKRIVISIIGLFIFIVAFFYYKDIPKSDKGKDEKVRQKDTPKQKHILTIVVSVKETELVDTLKSEGCLTPQTVEKLFQSKQWVLYDTEENWKKECQKLFEHPSQEQDEYDVYYIKIGLDESNQNFSQTSNMLKMYDAFKKLGEKKPDVQVSERQPKESYENKGFYRV